MLETTTEMMKDMIAPAGMDMRAMQDAIDAMSTCAQACTMCSDAMAGMDGMGTCASRCATCADVCTTTMRMLLRPAGMDPAAMTAMLQACVAMCSACASECRMHADTSATCAMCAQACDACMEACNGLLMSMGAVTSR